MAPSTQLDIIHAAASLRDALNQNKQTHSLIETEKPTALSFTTDSDHYSADARIVVGEQSIDIHRQYLSMVSPVFYEKFNGDTKEKQTGAVEIADFDFSTVKLVIDYCYGQQVNHDEALSNVFDILRFGHTYGIQQIIDGVESFLLANLSADNFCSIAQYSWKYERSDLKERCTAFFRNNHEEILFLTDFDNMEPSLAMEIVRMAKVVKK